MNEREERLLKQLKYATWLLDAVAAEIDRWFPDDPDPHVQSDLRKFAKQWREEHGFPLYSEAVAMLSLPE